MTRWPSIAIKAVFLGGIVLAAACSDSASPKSKNSAPNRNDIISAHTLPDVEVDHLLGRVNLPEPVWLPEHFPLPNDRHIYSSTEVGSVPPAHQLQARTMSSQADIRDAILQWGVEMDIRIEEASDMRGMLVLSISGGGYGGGSSVQIIEERRGNRRIILTLQDDS